MTNLLENLFLDFFRISEVIELIKIYNNISSFLLNKLNVTYLLIIFFVTISFLFLFAGSGKLKALYYFIFSVASMGNLLALLILFYDQGIDKLGWDKKSICRWVDLSQEFQELSIYGVQLTSNITTFNYNAPTFSLYYPPAIIDIIIFQCNFSNIIYNTIGLIFFVMASLVLRKTNKNINFLETLVFLQFGLSVYFWIFNSGQFFIFESTFLILGLIAVKNNKKIKSILLLILFGIQKIYFLILAALVSKEKKLIYWFTGILILLNFLNYNLIYDYFVFWFSEEGYIFGERVGFHSFFEEEFSSSSISLLFIIKKILLSMNLVESISLSSQRIILLITTFSVSLSLYFYFKKYFINTSETINFYFRALLITILFPLLKPYTLIIYLIITIFIANEMRKSYFLFSFVLLLIPNLITYTASNAIMDESIYGILEFSQFYILLIHFLTSCYLIKFKREKYIL